uniref:FAD-binding domain-containing protein n=1 Tax=Chromera velia CCMP2878 TaxID=1169474 RepID=A0A0G4IAQ4_9ALVE|eukprot:Cvel_12615.t1-p1 / transcript=Cvel_12615.t1 / gene=Cvel_12615 / organism=Chromera_velia_CCMP2878 / gene_product=Kynurenine 3-monooxygenase, putative / transcript_product=Kynurenine 3-monooxygenase, putative / location=Cvel_scaffold832:57116-59943(+) / protein_length=488 / sequence_SO=supercontig / SO=protein_coding / is_pseudo=false
MSKFAIIGGGPVGLLTASGLARRGFSVDVYEGRPSIDQKVEESYPIGVNLRGLQALECVDPQLRKDVEESGRVIDSWNIYGGKRMVAQVKSGACWSQSRYQVTKVIYDYATSSAVKGRVRVHFDKRLKDIDFSEVEGSGGDLKEKGVVHFYDGTSVEVGGDTGVTLIAADGSMSNVRKALVRYTAERAEAKGEGAEVERVQEDLVPWNTSFRVLFVDKETPDLDEKIHYIFGGAYTAVVGNGTQWALVPSCKTAAHLRDEWADWYFSEDPTEENVQKLKEYVKERCWPFEDVDRFFSEDELKAWFSRRIFTGALTRVSKLTYGGFVLLMGDAAHGVYPATGEGINGGMEDVRVLMETLDSHRVKVKEGGSPTEAASLREAMASYAETRQPDVDALHQLARKILSMSVGSTLERRVGLTESILYSIGQRVGLSGPNEAELRYGEPSTKELMKYSEVWKKAQKSSGWARGLAKFFIWPFTKREEGVAIAS